MAKILYLVIPCYNEEEVLADTAGKLNKKMKELMAEALIDVKSRIIFVNDGSMDLTWKIIEDLHNKDTLFGGINLTRNRGHQNALLAGLMTVKDDADIVISLDADLQDDINVFEEMLRKNNDREQQYNWHRPHCPESGKWHPHHNVQAKTHPIHPHLPYVSYC